MLCVAAACCGNRRLSSDRSRKMQQCSPTQQNAVNPKQSQTCKLAANQPRKPPPTHLSLLLYNAVWLLDSLLPKPVVRSVCCRQVFCRLKLVPCSMPMHPSALEQQQSLNVIVMRIFQVVRQHRKLTCIEHSSKLFPNPNCD